MPIWWEKTVEYKFLITLHDGGRIDFAAPLSGKHERSSGDAIFGEHEKLVLVEFKRDEGEIDSEISIFKDYKKAQDSLGGFNHHWIVYGRYNDEGFELCGRKYFGGDVEGEVLNILDNGVSEECFSDYLQRLNEYKIPDARGGGGHVSPEGMATVLGVSSGGKVIKSMTLADYCPSMYPALTYATLAASRRKKGVKLGNLR